MANIIQLFLTTGARVTFETRDETFEVWQQRLGELLSRDPSGAMEPVLVHDARYMPPTSERSETGYEDFWVRPSAIAAFTAFKK